MDNSKSYSRDPWHDRFNTPSISGLRTGLAADAARLFDSTRRRILDFDGVHEVPAWYGDAWHWTIEYRVKGCRDEPLALVIPAPTDLQLAIPLDREFAESLPVRRMTRSVRDGLKLAQPPFDTRWAVWSIAAAGQLNDLQDLLERKLQHLGKRVG